VQVVCAAAQIDVFGQHTCDLRLVELDVPGERGQQQPLLRSEVARAHAFEKFEKDTPRMGGTLLARALEVQRREQSLMVLVR
jgi:hypothetical protein